MRLPKPTTRVRNLMERIRGMDDSLRRLEAENAAVREELGSLKSEIWAASSEIRDVIDLARRTAALGARRSTLRRTRTRVLFLVHNAATWDSIADITEIMLAEDDFEPIVASIAHRYSGVGPSKGERKVHGFLESRGIPHVRLPPAQTGAAPELLRALDPDIVFRQSQWDADVDVPFRTDELSTSRLALVPYETMNVIQNVPIGDPPVNTAVDSSMHRAAWLVFLANEEALDIARRDSLTGGLQFRVVGHPKLDRLRAALPDWPDSHPDGPRRRRVLWSAHHSILSGWSDFGMFPAVRDEMITWARSEPETEFTYVHHPLLPDTIRRPGGPMTFEEYEAWREDWASCENTFRWRGSYAQPLAATDFLITDSPSMMIEGQILNKPTIFLERDGHTVFNAIGAEMSRGVHLVPDIDAARSVIREIENAGHDPLAEQQKRNVVRFLGTAGAARRIVETIRAEISSERGRAIV